MSKGPKLSLYYSDRQDDGRAYRAPQVLGLEDAVSVTTVLKMEAKDALSQWAADMTAHRAATQTDMLLTRSVPDAANGIRYWWKNFRDDRASIGTAVHEYIEKDQTGSWDFPEVWDQEVAQCIEQYNLFKSQHTVEPVMVETTLWSETHGYAGTADFIGLIDGEMWLLDNKTSRSLWDSHGYQVAALENADYAFVEVTEGAEGALRYESPKKDVSWWVKTDLPKIEKRGFLHLRPDETHPLTGKFKPASWELVEMPEEEVAPSFHAFLGFKQAWDGLSGLKALRALRSKDESANVDNEQKEEK